MIDWAAGYSCEWRVFEVNPDTWADAGQVGTFSGLKVSEDASDQLVQKGSMTVTAPAGEEFAERYLRVAMTAKSSTGSERVDVCTMLWSGTSGSINRGYDSQSLRGSSVLYPASRTQLPDLSYAPSGTDCARLAASMLRRVLKAPVDVSGDGFTLDEPMYFNLDESVLSAVTRMLDAGGYVTRLDGRGNVHIEPRPTEPALVIDGSTARMVSSGVRYTADLSSVPNRLRVVSGGQSVTVENDDPDSRTSHQRRGYWDDVTEREPTRTNGETLHEYARRRLREMSVLRVPYSYQRRWVPDVHVSSVVKSDVQSMRGILYVSRQTMTCGKDGISVQEEAYREEELWLG